MTFVNRLTKGFESGTWLKQINSFFFHRKRDKSFYSKESLTAIWQFAQKKYSRQKRPAKVIEPELNKCL